MCRWRPGMSLLAKLSRMASTRSWPFRMSSCCLAISCSAIRVSWSAIARRSLAACARLALTWSEIMIDSCGRLRMVSSSGHGVLSKPTTLPRKSQTTMPVVMPMNTYIEPQNLFTASAMRSRMLVPRTCWDRMSLGRCASGLALIFSARSFRCDVASSISCRAAPSLCGRGVCGDSATCPPGSVIVSVMVPPSWQAPWPAAASHSRDCHNLASSARLARGDQAGLVGEDDELGPVAGTELDHRPADVGLGSGGAEHHGLGDLVVGQAMGDQGDHLPLPVGEALHPGRRDRVRRPGHELADQAAGDRGGQQRVAAHDDPQRLEQLGRLGVLQQEPARARPQCAEDVL